MRIIGGKYKGKRLLAPKNIKARPTTDFGKESLFNILNNRVDFNDLVVLDLFTGTGNIAFEFASRGAKSVVAVDIALASFRFVMKTARSMDFPGVWVVKSDAFKFLRQTEEKFDLIFADPPYGHEDIANIPELVFERKLLQEDGILVIEHGKETDLSAHANLLETRTYGRVNFSFFTE